MSADNKTAYGRLPGIVYSTGEFHAINSYSLLRPSPSTGEVSKAFVIGNMFDHLSAFLGSDGFYTPLGISGAQWYSLNRSSIGDGVPSYKDSSQRKVHIAAGYHGDEQFPCSVIIGKKEQLTQKPSVLNVIGFGNVNPASIVGSQYVRGADNVWRAQMIAATSNGDFAFEGNLEAQSGEATFPIERPNFEDMPYVVRAMHAFNVVRPPGSHSQVAWWDVSGQEHVLGQNFRAHFEEKDLLFPQVLNAPTAS